MENFLDDTRASYDVLAKKFLSRKAILAQILKYAVSEFADYELEEIEKKYIEGEPELAINTIPLDDTLDIKGKNTESNSPREGLVTFDIVFDALVPVNGESVKFIINVEAQKTTKKIDYKLMKRAVYYVARLISSQKEKEFHGDNYDSIKKIYSIWICMDVQKYRADSIQEYRIKEKSVHGKFRDKIENYDLMTIVVLNLGKNPTSHKLLNLLHLLFMELKTSEEKEKILNEEYNINLTGDMKKELEEMGGLMKPLLDIAVEEAVEKAVVQASEKTRKESKIEDIRNLMKKLKMTAQEAMDILDIPNDKQREYITLI